MKAAVLLQIHLKWLLRARSVRPSSAAIASSDATVKRLLKPRR
jgi:hypothetical protein